MALWTVQERIGRRSAATGARWYRPGLVAALVVLVTVPVVVLASPAVAAGDPAPAPAAPAAPGTPAVAGLPTDPDGDPVAPDAATAVAAAATAGRPVVIDDLTDEYTRHFANPDGTRMFEQYLVPQRVRRGPGWVPVDTTLRRVGDRIAPAAAVLDMSFSAGGSAELVSVTDRGLRLGLSWPGKLPKPVLAGDTATYPEVLPGVDLVVRAEPESFAQLLVVKHRQAAANPALARVAWDVSTEGLRLRTRADGVVEAVDGAGEVVFRAPAPLMWDSPAPAPAAPALWPAGEPWENADPEATPGMVRVMPVQSGAGRLEVRPDLAALADPDTVFPVMIDPSFSKGATNWAPVNKADPNRSYPSGTGWPRDYVRVGETWGDPGVVWRSHFRFTISSMDSQDLVGNPSFLITLDHSASCGSTPVQLWRTNTIGSGNVTWNSMKSKWLHGGPLQTKSAHANEGGGCGSIQPDVSMEFSNSNLRSRLQGAMDAGYSTFTLGLRASNESDEFQWKRFKRGSAKLTAVYNLKPNQPTNLAITSSCYPGSCSSPAMVRNRQPTLRAKVTDPNKDAMQVQFEVRNSSKSSVVASTSQVTGVSSGSSPTWRTPTLPQESRFHFRVRAKDQVGWGPWSGYYTFTVDTLAPAMPDVSGTLYQHKDTGTWNGGVGQPGSFTFGPNGADDVISYQWRLNGGTVKTENVSTGAGRTLDITPTADLEQLLEVRSIDHAGNTSGWRPYPFYVRPQPVDVAYWKFDEGSGGTAATASGNPAYAGILQGGAGWAASGLGLVDPGASGTALSLDGSDDYVEMPRVVATNHAAGFSVSAWVRPAVFDNYHAIVAQHGANTYAFRLYYKPETDKWCFRVRHADDTASGNTGVCSTADPQTGVWTHLAAVYDRPAGKLRLYVNGGPDVFDPEFGQGTVDEVSAPPLWASEGTFTVGRKMLEGAEWWDGRIDEVRVYQRVLAGSDVAQMFASCRFGSCPEVAPVTEPVLVGAWDLDEGTGTTTSDASGLGGDGTLTGGASWVADGYGSPAAVSLDGVSGAVETSGPVLLTDQSFTVSAWARLTDRTSWHTVVSQDGVAMSPFRLEYNPSADAWCFRLFHADQPAAGSTVACGATPQLDKWTHLVGVFDAATLQLRVYVDGQPGEQKTYNNPVWRADGPLTIGRTRYTGASTIAHDYFAGQIDQVRAYQGALTGPEVSNLYDEQLDRSPTAVVDSPAGSLAWQAGDVVGFSGHATDPQGALPASALSWQLRLVDCTGSPCQTEVLQEWTGVAAGTFTAPDAPYPSHLELALTAESGPGAADTALVRLDPATVDLTFAANPAGLQLPVDSVPGTAPFTRTVIQGASVVVEAPAPQDLAGTSYVFESWSDGGDQDHVIVAPTGPATYTAGYRAAVDLQPTAVIDTPAGSPAWTAGQEIGFTGHATDPQGALPASALSWQLRLVDCTGSPCQTEILDDWTGVAGGTFTAPDAPYPSHLELELTADNGPGFTDSAVVQLDPATVDLTFQSQPAGRQLTVDGTSGVAPFTRTVIQGSAVEVDAPAPQESGGTSYLFGSWSDGGTQSHAIVAPAAPATYTASYLADVPGTGCGTDAFGHTCTAGPRPFQPTPDPLPLAGDDAVAEVSLPFPVWLYGKVYETAWVDTNGLVTFLEPETSAASVATIPAGYQWGEADAALYPFWHDWLVDAGASVRTGLAGAAPDRQFVIEWRDVTTPADNSVRVSFQVVLHEDGRIGFAWDGIGSAPVEQGASGVVGIENELGTEALAYSQFTASLASGQGVLFTPPAPGTVSGVVTESGTGTPVEDALVTLQPAGWSVFTEDDGSYQFTGVPVGTYGVVARREDGRCAGPDAATTISLAAGGAATADVSIGPGTDTSGNVCTEGPQAFLPTTDVLDLTGYYGNTEVPLPFPVRLYGSDYTTAWVDVDGVVTFLEPESELADVSPIPSPPAWARPNAAVYPFWNDWMVIDGATIRTGTVGSAPNRQFVIEWRDVMADQPPHPRVSFQVVFHETGEIAMAWDGIGPSLLEQGENGVIGIENGAGSEALVYSQFAPSVADGWGAVFTPPPVSSGQSYTTTTGPRAFLPAGDPLALSGDDASTAVSLPFPVSLYGQSYPTAWVDTNGVVTFEEPDGSSWNVSPIPSAAAANTPNAAVYPFWSDLIVDSQASVLTGTVGTAPDRQFVVEWRNVQFWADRDLRVSFQVLFRETGEIAMAWDGIGSTPLEQGGSAVVGVEDAHGRDAVVHSQFAPVLASGEGVLFTPDTTPDNTGGLAGTVTCQGSPVDGAQVSVAGQSAVTGLDGGWQLGGVTVGTYTVVATAAGGICAGSTPAPVTVVGGTTTTVDTPLASSTAGYQIGTGPQPFLPVSDELLLSGDDSFTAVSFPFPVSLYGRSYPTGWVDTNGVVTFEEPDGSSWHTSGIPSAAAANTPNTAVYPFWSDWIVDSEASVLTGTAGAAPDRQFVIEWRNVRLWQDADRRASFQVVFSENGQIALSWDELDGTFLERGGGAVVGIENADGTEALAYSQFTPVLASGEGVRFTPAVPPAGTGDLAGTVTCAGSPAGGVHVAVAGQSVVTGPDGTWQLAGVAVGTYSAIATAAGGTCAGSTPVPVTVVGAAVTTADIALAASGTGYLASAGPRPFVPLSSVLGLSGDDTYTSVSLPFPVSLYGQSSSTVWVDTNGVVTLVEPDGSSWNASPIPSAAEPDTPDAAVYPFWSDLVVDSPASVLTGVVGSAPNRQFVVEWRNVRLWADPDRRMSFQVVFFETGAIAVAWDDLDGTFLERGGGAVVGIENADGTEAVAFSQFHPVLTSGQGVLFTPPSS
jgi:hypothetical protein